MKLIWVFGYFFVLLGAICVTQAQADSAMCETGSIPLVNDDNEDSLNKVVSAFKPGDIIQIPSGGRDGSRAVPRLCDFSKEMPIVGGPGFWINHAVSSELVLRTAE